MSQGPTEIVGDEKGAYYAAAFLAANRMANEGMSWSGNERNCCFLNTAGLRFANVSATAGLDLPDDGRAFAVVDWDHDGDLDLFQINRTAPQVRFLRNNWGGDHHFLSIRLVGKSCHRDAIGARVRLFRKGLAGFDTRTLYAGSSFLSQSSKWVHFGLGQHTDVEKVIVHWPGGQDEEFSGMRADGRYQLVQGTGTPLAIPKRKTVKLKSSSQKLPLETDRARAVLASRALLPRLSYQDFDGHDVNLAFPAPTLVHLWASWCPVCRAELQEFRQRAKEIVAAGVRVVTLSVDGLGTDTSTVLRAREAIQNYAVKHWTTGSATEELLAKLELLRGELFSNERPYPVPTSFLVDAKGRLVVIYLGPVKVDQLLTDARELTASDRRLREFSSPLKGRWFTPFKPILLTSLASAFQERGFLDDAQRYQTRAAPQIALNNCVLALDLERQGNIEAATRHYQKALRLSPDSARVRNLIGRHLMRKRDLAGARQHFLAAVQLEPNLADAHRNLGATYVLSRHPVTAIACYRRALKADPEDANAHVALGRLLQQQNEVDDAETHLRAAIRIEPTLAAAYVYLGIIYAARAELESAIEMFEKAIGIQSDLADAYLGLAQVLQTQGKISAAAGQYRQALRIQPSTHVASMKLAWLIATDSGNDLGSAQEAEQLAFRAAQSTRFRSARPLSVLAAVYAHIGEFDRARSTAEKALSLSANDEKLSAQIRQMLLLYQNEKPYRRKTK